MDTCSWNWGVIASLVSTFVTALTALYISFQWRKQKGSEVISNEAAKLLLLLQDYREKLIQIHSLAMDYEKNSP